MFAFGHFFSTYFLLRLLKFDRKKALILSIIGLAPDIDLLLGIPHRTITHHIYFFIPELIMFYVFTRRFNILIPFLIHSIHIFSDLLFGPVEIFPGISVSIINFPSPIWDCIYGLFFLLISEIFCQKS